MFDDLRLEWICQRTCQLLNISSTIFVDFIERNDGVNEDLIDRFFNRNQTFAERIDALIFHCENSQRNVWRMSEMIVDDELDEIDEEIILLKINESIDSEREFSVEFVEKNVQRSPIEHLRVINEFDGKQYRYELKSFDETRLFCHLENISNLISIWTKKTFLYFIRIDFNSILTIEEMNESIHFGLVPRESSLFYFKEIFEHFFSTNDRKEFHRFRSQLDSTWRQIQGEFHLNLPTKTLLMNNDETDDEFIENVEYFLSDCEKILQDELNNELNRRVNNATPLAEVQFWHERSIRISAILEQMNKDELLRMIKLLNDFDSPASSAFLNLKSQFQTYLFEATDNYKFLLTIERYLKTIETATNFSTINKILPNLMQGLKTIWTMSKHYNKDERFVPFMEKIANEIIDRVRQIIDLKSLFSSISLNEAKELCSQAKNLLSKWKNEYEKTRKSFENEKRTISTWNFDSHVLFDKTDSMSQICDDLIYMLTNLNEFYQIFGTDLKNVTSNEEKVNEILENVSQLQRIFLQCQFDPFQRENASQWRTLIDDFQHRSSLIEKEAKFFIRTAFTQLRSAENALDMLKKFEHFSQTHVLAQEMIQQFVAILVQYCKEIDEIERIFHQQKIDPPIDKAFPPVAGAIRWSRFLFSQIRIPMDKFRSMDQFLFSEQGARAKERFIQIATMLKDYENQLFKIWLDQMKIDLPKFLKENLLIDAERNERKILSRSLMKNFHHRIEKSRRTRSTNEKPVEIRYSVSSISSLRQALIECSHLEKLTFHLPDSFVQTTFQLNKFELLATRLRSMLDDFHLTLSSFDTIEVSLLHSHVEQIQRTIDRGVTRVTWADIGTFDYVDQCEKQLIEFHSILNLIRKISADIREHLETFRLSRVDPIVPRDDQGELLQCRAYFDFLDEKREEILSNLKRRYELIGPLLTKIEALIFGTNTGKHPSMRSFYAFWEQEIFNSLVELVLRNLCQFFSNIFAHSSTFFIVRVLISPTRLVLQPTLDELINTIRRSAHGISKLPKYFTRWLNGSCLLSPTIPLVDLTFYNDVKQHPDVIDMLKPIRSNASTLVTSINRILNQLINYNDLWKTDKHKYVNRFASNHRNCVDYDEVIRLFEKLDEIFDRSVTKRRIGSIELSLKEFYHGLKHHCHEWIHLYTEQYFQRISQLSKETNDRIDSFFDHLKHETDTVNDLKFVLNLIEQINGEHESLAHRIHQIEQSNRIFKDFPTSTNLENRLELLMKQSRLVQHRLQPIRQRFRHVVQSDVEFFQNLVDEFVEKFDRYGPLTNGDDLDEILRLVRHFNDEFQQIEHRKNDLINMMKLFEIPLRNFPQLIRVQHQLDQHLILIEFFDEFKREEKLSSQNLWKEFDVQLLINNVDAFLKRFRKFSSQIKSFRLADRIEKYLKNFRSSLPIIADLKHDALRERHWKQLSEEIPFDDHQVMTLENLFRLNLHQHDEHIQKILQTAIKESNIEKNLHDIQQQWDSMRFQLHRHQSQEKTSIIAGVDEILQNLEDSSLLLHGISTSRFVGVYLTQVEQWIRILTLISDVIKLWIVVQQKWIYLENIFIGSNLQLTDEAKRFEIVDKMYRKIMLETSRNPLVKSSCLHPGRYDEFKSILTLIENIQKNLNDFLDTKREIFPRFYFISDDELLSIIGSADPTQIQPFLPKMFDNISSLDFQSLNANGMISFENEQMNFLLSIDCQTKVELWMLNVEKEMKRTNRLLTKESIFYYRFHQTRLESMRKYIGMVVLVVNQIWSTWEIEDQFEKITKYRQKSAMKIYVKQLNNQIEEIVLEMRQVLSNNEYKKFETVLTIDVHTRDMVENLIRDGIQFVYDFAWQSQLRFYWLFEEDDVFLRQCDGKFQYGYEYMGLNGRLVITPLTDRIYLTITQALTMFLGCAPAGPAGTGKTESVKDLAKAMGLLCVVTNCGEGMDYQAFGKTLNGLCQTGSWGCFDEFNRIDASVLSVVSTQVKTIQRALALQQEKFFFENRSIRLIKTVGIFITMNPGYAGRTELPESVKTLFRPVVVVVPNLQYIGEIKLFANGFLQARLLAKKMVTLYRYASELLSKQFHYDWGLRNFKSVLSMTGHLKRTSMKNASEESVLLRALRDVNLPKFIYDDTILFQSLLNDLFPNLPSSSVEYVEFQRTIEQVLTQRNLTIVASQISKILQLYETMMTRHSTMIVGPTTTGKTVVLNILAQSQSQMGTKTTLYTLNPKAMSVVELYGFLDPLTREWTDGLISMLYRTINRPTTRNERRYIVFDGDVDALWIENMNSVMDDNKLLTLANGERIRLQEYSSLLFEVADLKYASPATVSRCGMVFIDPENLGPHPVWSSWLNLRFVDRNDLKEQFENLYQRYVPTLNNLIYHGVTETERRSRMKMIVHRTPVNLIVQLTKFLDCLFLPFIDSVTKNDVLHQSFLQCLIWSFGSCLNSTDRITFDRSIRYHSGLSLNDNELLFDCFYDIELDQWTSWERLLPSYQHDRTKRFSEIFVPTIDTIRLEWLMSSMLKIHQPVLFVGETGSSKTSTIRSFLRRLNTENRHLIVQFSSRTKSIDVQRSIENQIEKRSKDTFGPTIGTRLLIFLDDVSMPKIDAYGTQQAIAFLKLLIEKNGMFDRTNDFNWKNLVDIEWIGAMGTPGGGNQNVDPRFFNHFSVFYISSPSFSSLFRIFSTILQNHVTNFPLEIRETIPSIIRSTLEIYFQVQRKFLPTPNKFHYIFSLRDLSRIVQSLLQTNVERFNTIERFLRVWINECLRVFADRFVESNDRNLFDEILEKTFEKNSHWKTFRSFSFRQPILFGDFRTALRDIEPNIYEDLQDFQAMKSLFDELIENQSNEFVFFDEAIEHLIRIYRILRLERGHVLLIGAGASGKQTISRLATSAARYQLFEIQLTKNYNEQTFRDDLKRLFVQVGQKNLRTVFLLNENQMIDESFFEYLNQILSNGFISTLFNDEEREEILRDLRDETSKEFLWDLFVQRASENLHLILCMNSNGESLRHRIRSFPALINNTTIDYFSQWSQKSLLTVAEHFLSTNKSFDDDLKFKLVEHMTFVHQSANFYSDFRRKIFIVPKNFLEFLQTFLRLYKEKSDDFLRQIERLTSGIVRIDQASVLIREMDKKLEKQRKELAIKTKKCDDLLDEITQLTTKQNERKTRSVEKKRIVDEQILTIEKEKRDAENQLADAMPALLEAQHGLDTLKAADITEMRSFANPVDTLRLIGYSMLIYLAHPTISWKDVRAVMADMKFITHLKTRDPDTFTSKQMIQLKIHLKKLEEKLDPNHLFSHLAKNEREEKLVLAMNSVSRVGAGLLKFLFAVDHYMEKFHEIKPKKDRLQSLENEFEINRNELSRLETSIEKLTETLNEFRQRFNTAIEEKIRFQDQTDLAVRRRSAAEKLLDGFQKEKFRWQNDLIEIRKSQDELIGHCLLASAFLAYASPFNSQIRTEFIEQQWKQSLIEKQIRFDENFRLELFFSSNVEISEWISQGLPADENSIQNAILTLKTHRYSFCIDPQLQCLNWIEEREKKSNLKVFSMKNRDFVKHLELAVKYGYPVLFKDCDEYLDPILFDVLSKKTIVRLGEKILDVDPNFRMFFTCRLAKPNLSTLHYSMLKVINYTVTFSGLEDQLLSALFKIERSEIDEIRENLIEKIFENQREQKLLEDSLLRELTTSTGNLLDNNELIETLENTKNKVNEVTKALTLAERTRQEIEESRNAYRPVARHAAVLYFTLVQMSTINPMYQYALSSFLRVFQKSLQISKFDDRLRSIIDTLTYEIYLYGTTGMFEKDKYLFSFLLTIEIDLEKNFLQQNQIDFFLHGNLQIDKEKSIYSWLNDESFHHCRFLSEHFPEKFSTILKNFDENSAEWKFWLENDRIIFPKPFDQILNPFEELMLLRCFSRHRIVNGMNDYVRKRLGEKFLVPSTIHFDSIFEHSTSNIAVIFILSAGSDPTNDLQKLAERKSSTNLTIVALGQGQEKIALQALRIAQQQGSWLLLQNCHLLLSFLNEIDATTKTHVDFRLWMTTEPVENFPVGLLQRSFKVVIEPPSTLKLILRSTFMNLSHSTFSQCEHPIYPCFIYILAYFHAIILDRRKYGKFGWSCFYDFNESDFRVSLDLIQRYFNRNLQRSSLEIPWTTLKFLIGDLIYAGRVIDSYDRRLIQTYINEYFGPFVFDREEIFHFYRDRFDYFLPEIRDFLSLKQRWLLKRSNIEISPIVEQQFESILTSKIAEQFPQFDGKENLSSYVFFNLFFSSNVFRDFYLNYVDQLPRSNPPETLGLHSNVERIYFSSIAEQIRSSMIKIRTEIEENHDENSFRSKFILSSIENIQKRIPPKIIFKSKNHSALNVVLSQEIQRWNSLTSIIWKSIDELRQALIGQTTFSFELEQMSRAIYHGDLPILWRNSAPQTTKSLGNWLEHFQRRNEQYEQWIDHGELKTIQLGLLHVPEAFLAAVIQTVARKNQWPLDKVTFYTEITTWLNIDEIDESLQGFSLIEGLILEGAAWHRQEKRLLEQIKGKIRQTMPLMKFIPIESSRLHRENHLATPVYVTSDRRNAMGQGFVFEASLPTNRDLSHWILNGVCLLLNND